MTLPLGASVDLVCGVAADCCPPEEQPTDGTPCSLVGTLPASVMVTTSNIDPAFNHSGGVFEEYGDTTVGCSSSSVTVTTARLIGFGWPNGSYECRYYCAVDTAVCRTRWYALSTTPIPPGRYRRVPDSGSEGDYPLIEELRYVLAGSTGCCGGDSIVSYDHSATNPLCPTGLFGNTLTEPDITECGQYIGDLSVPCGYERILICGYGPNSPPDPYDWFAEAVWDVCNGDPCTHPGLDVYYMNGVQCDDFISGNFERRDASRSWEVYRQVVASLIERTSGTEEQCCYEEDDEAGASFHVILVNRNTWTKKYTDGGGKGYTEYYINVPTAFVFTGVGSGVLQPGGIVNFVGNGASPWQDCVSGPISCGELANSFDFELGNAVDFTP